jgi:hypothetical protein
MRATGKNLMRNIKAFSVSPYVYQKFVQGMSSIHFVLRVLTEELIDGFFNSGCVFDYRRLVS